MACCCPAVRVKDYRSIAGSGNPSSASVARAPGGVAVGHGLRMLSACRWAEVFPFRWFATGRIFRPWSRPRLKRPSIFPGNWLLCPPVVRFGFPAFRPLFCGPGAVGFKKNRPPVQQVRLKTEKISTEGLEVCYKSFYLCTTPQGRVGCSGRSSHERKKGLTGVKRGNRKGKTKKNFKSFFGSPEKIPTFAVPSETAEKQKKIKEGAMPSEYSGYGS